MQWPGRLLVLLVLIFNAAFAAAAGVASHPFVVSGVIKGSGNSQLLRDFVDYLSVRSDYPLRVVYVESYQGLSQQLRGDPMAVGWTCGAPFVEDQAVDGQQLVAVPLFQGAPTYHSLLIARTGVDEQHLADFRGTILAYGDLRSNSGFIVPAFVLQQAGLDIHSHFRLLLHTGNHERSIEAVLHGLADVAAVDEYVWVEYLRSHPQAGRKLTVLERYGPYPFTPVVTGNAVPPDAVGRLQNALVDMMADPAGQILLERLHLDGFVRRPAAFYRPIAGMLESLDMQPEGESGDAR